MMEVRVGSRTSKPSVSTRTAVVTHRNAAVKAGFARVPQTKGHGHPRAAPLRAATSVRTRLADLLEQVERKYLSLLDIKDKQPVTVKNISNHEIKKCLEYGAWVYGSYAKYTKPEHKDEYLAALLPHKPKPMKADDFQYKMPGWSLDRVKQIRDSDTNVIYTTHNKVIEGSVVILSGSSELRGDIKTDTQALVGLQDDGKGGVELVVAFRGSETIDDWLTDFYIHMDDASDLVSGLEKKSGFDKDKKCLVHAGFTKSLNDFLKPNTTNYYGYRDATGTDRDVYADAKWKQENGKQLSDKEERALNLKETPTLMDLAHDLTRQFAPGKKISKVVSCGHSLGGALATLAAFVFSQPDKDGKVPFPGARVEYYSFGAPRVGNETFAKLWNQAVFDSDPTRAYRIVHRHDIVAGIPFANLPIPLGPFTTAYYHVEGGVLLCQPNEESFVGDSDLPKEWPLPKIDHDGYQAQRRPRPIDLTENNKSTDHGVIEHYLPALISALKNS